jgi:hypothetical protein
MGQLQQKLPTALQAEVHGQGWFLLRSLGLDISPCVFLVILLCVCILISSYKNTRHDLILPERPLSKPSLQIMSCELILQHVNFGKTLHLITSSM